MMNDLYKADGNRYDGTMKYRRSGRSGILLSELSLGLWHNFGGVDLFENGKRMLHYAFDKGVTYFDLANNYGLRTARRKRTWKGDEVVVRYRSAVHHTKAGLNVAHVR